MITQLLMSHPKIWVPRNTDLKCVDELKSFWFDLSASFILSSFEKVVGQKLFLAVWCQRPMLEVQLTKAVLPGAITTDFKRHCRGKI